MARIFISHSSKNNFESVAFRDWLISIGYEQDDVFLDLHSLGAGDRWREKLRSANRRCEAVILLASLPALASDEVRREIILAEEYRKPVLVALLEDLSPAADPLTPYRQGQIVNIVAQPQDTTFAATIEGHVQSVHFNGEELSKIRARLNELGLEAATFAWTPEELLTANPFPGLQGYTEADAGVFFGRDPDIARGLAKMREIHSVRDGRFLIIQAASGAGKSSFLKAGLWPRLHRDGSFETITILRPAGGIISGQNGLARALTTRLAKLDAPRMAPAAFAKRLLGDSEEALSLLDEALSHIAAKAADAVRVVNDEARAPSLVIGIDQGEELFAPADLEESTKFTQVLSKIRKYCDVSPIFVFTLRDDSFGELLEASNKYSLPELEVLALPPIPRELFIEVIREPARVANEVGLDFDIPPDLAERMINDSRGKDSLPLLSVMLEQMVEDNRLGTRVHLTLASYIEQGGVAGALRSRLEAARRAASAFLPAAASEDTLKRLMVPRLATWDADAQPPVSKRLLAREEDVVGRGAAANTNIKLLADQMVAKHLLTRSADQEHGVTLEVTHEALLRQPPISDWLEADSDFLTWLATIDRARQVDSVNIGKLVFGQPIETVENWIADRNDAIPAINRRFVETSLREAELRQERELKDERQRRRLREAELEAAKEREASQSAQLIALESKEAAASARSDAARKVANRTMLGMGVSILLAAATLIGFFQATKSEQVAAEAAEAEAVARQQADTNAAKVIKTNEELQIALAKAEEAQTLAKTKAREADESANELAKTAAAAELNRREALHRESRFLASAANEAAPSDMMALAWEALPKGPAPFDLEPNDRPFINEAFSALVKSYLTIKERHVLTGHAESITDFAVSPDGEHVISWSEYEARLWSITSGEFEILDDRSTVLAVDISKDSKLAATASRNGNTQLWSLESGKLLRTFHGHTDGVRSVAFSPDGSLIATGSDDKSVRLWSSADGAQLRRFDGHEDWVIKVQFVGDQNLLSSIDTTGLVKFWQTTKQIRSRSAEIVGENIGSALSNNRTSNATDENWYGFKNDIPTAYSEMLSPSLLPKFSPDGRWLAFAGGSDTISLLPLFGGGKRKSLQGHEQSVSAFAFSADSAQLVSGDDRGAIWVWDTSSGKKVQGPIDAHNGTIRDISFSPDGSAMVTAGDDRKAKTWSTDSYLNQDVLEAHDGPILRAKYFADRKVVTSSQDRTLRIWSTQAGIVRNLPSAASDSTFTPEGNVVVADFYGIHLWRTETGGNEELITRLSVSPEVIGSVLSPDGRSVASLFEDRVRLESLAEPEKDPEYPFPELMDPKFTSFSADGQHIVAMSQYGTTYVRRLGTAGRTKTLITDTQDYWSSILAVSYNAEIIATSYGPTPLLYSTDTGEIHATLVGHSGDVTTIVFAPNGNIATTSWDQTVKIWREDGTLLRTLRPMLRSLAFLESTESIQIAYTRDGTGLVIGTSAGDIQVWSTESWEQIFTYPNQGEAILGMDFDNDNKRLAVMLENEIKIFPFWGNPATLIAESGKTVAKLNPLTIIDRCRNFLEQPRHCEILGNGVYYGDMGSSLLARGRDLIFEGDEFGADRAFNAVSEIDNSAGLAAEISEIKTQAFVDLAMRTLLSQQNGKSALDRMSTFYERAQDTVSDEQRRKIVNALLEFAVNQLENSQNDIAEEAFAKTLDISPEDRSSEIAQLKLEVFLERGRAQLIIGEETEAERFFEEASRIGGESVKMSIINSRINGWLERSLSLSWEFESFEDAVSAEDKLSEFRTKYDSAQKAIEIAHEMVRTEAQNQESVETAVSVLTNAGIALIALDHLEEGVVRFDDAEKLAPSRGETLEQQKIDALIKRAWQARREKNYSAATKAAMVALTAMPENTKALIVLGAVASSLDDQTLALERLNSAVKIEPENGNAHNWLAYLHDRIGNYELALRHAKLAIRAETTSKGPWGRSWSLLRLDGRFEEAEEVFREFSKTKTDFIDETNTISTSNKVYDKFAAEVLFRALDRLSWLAKAHQDTIGQTNVDTERRKTSTDIGYTLGHLISPSDSDVYSATDCDRAASFPHDPLKVVSTGMWFTDIPPGSVESCDKAIRELATNASLTRRGQLLYQRARARERFENLEDAKRDYSSALELGYPAAFNNLGHVYETGEWGLDSDEGRSSKLHAEAANRWIYCCWRTGVDALRAGQFEGREDAYALGQMLMQWAAAYGSADAHAQLVSEYAENQTGQAYFHAGVFEKLTGSEIADKGEFVLELLPQEREELDIKIEAWEALPFDADAPALRRLFAATGQENEIYEGETDLDFNIP